MGKISTGVPKAVHARVASWGRIDAQSNFPHTDCFHVGACEVFGKNKKKTQQINFRHQLGFHFSDEYSVSDQEWTKLDRHTWVSMDKEGKIKRKLKEAQTTVLNFRSGKRAISLPVMRRN